MVSLTESSRSDKPGAKKTLTVWLGRLMIVLPDGIGSPRSVTDNRESLWMYNHG